MKPSDIGFLLYCFGLVILAIAGSNYINERNLKAEINKVCGGYR